MDRTTPTPIDLATRIQQIERRLDDGYRLIDERQRRGEDVQALEDFWIALLHEYEDLCTELPIAA